MPATGGISNVDPRDIDLSEVEREFQETLDSLWSGWDQISAEWRRQIVDQVRVSVTSNDLNALAAISVSTTAAQEALVDAMVDMALTAAQTMAHEAKDQGTPIDPVASDSAVFSAVAAVVVALLAGGMANSAGREALRQWSETTSGDDVSRSVDRHLRELSDAFPRQQLGAALTSAQNTGRLNTALSGPSGALYASEVMDRNTCPPCAQVDGKWLGNTDDPATPARVAEVYPNGGYRFCEGGVKCRGTVVYIVRPQRVSGEAV